MLTVVVTAANVQDREGAQPLLEVLRHHFSRLRADLGRSSISGDLTVWLGITALAHSPPGGHTAKEARDAFVEPSGVID